MKYKARETMVLLLLFFFFSCGFTPFFAPENSEIILQSDKSHLNLGNDRARITILGFSTTNQVLRDHTRVMLSASLGTIPAYVDLIDGQGVVDFVSGNENGEAEIEAFSGKVKAQSLLITIGAAGVSELIVSANPQNLDPGGGRSEIVVLVFDANRNPLANIPVMLAATNGNFEQGPGPHPTDANGRVANFLRTTKTSEVTASAGAISQKVTVTVRGNTPPIAKFSYSPSEPRSEETVYFNASASMDLDGYIAYYDWDFGDGSQGTGRTATHVYKISGSASRKFKVMLQVTDNDGAKAVAEVEVTVIPIAGAR